MKFLIFSFVLVAAASAQLINPLSQPIPGKPIAILRQAQDISPEGAYSYSYETENGISAQETGVPKALGPKGEPAVVAQGSYSYVGPDGTPYTVTYIADENGFQPQGDHIPASPSVGQKTPGRF